MARLIGVRHQLKLTEENEMRPTQLHIVEGDQVRKMDLETDDDELDFVKGRLPVVYREPVVDEDLTQFDSHRIAWRDIKEGEEFPANLTRLFKEKGKKARKQVAIKVPAEYDWFKAGDKVCMLMGGSGDDFAYALSRRGEEIGAEVYRISPRHLKDLRKERSKDEDAELLVQAFLSDPGLFYFTGPRDRKMIAVREAFRARQQAMRDRIVCGQRLRQIVKGRAMRTEDGPYPEGAIEEQYELAQANDELMQSLILKEKQRVKELESALEVLPIYSQILAEVDGVGPMTAARIVSAIYDIRRFPSRAGFEYFCGVATDKELKFLRRRRGQVSNWHPDCRQSLYLLGDIFNKNPDTFWGQKLREIKAKLQEAHPEVVEVDKVKRYTKGHIQKMALWKTRNRFARWVWSAWWKHEREQGKAQPTQQVA